MIVSLGEKKRKKILVKLFFVVCFFSSNKSRVCKLIIQPTSSEVVINGSAHSVYESMGVQVLTMNMLGWVCGWILNRPMRTHADYCLHCTVCCAQQWISWWGSRPWYQTDYGYTPCTTCTYNVIPLHIVIKAFLLINFIRMYLKLSKHGAYCVISSGYN